MEELKKKLLAPFPAKDIEWRVSRSYKKDNGSGAFVLAYITSRAVQDRLDECFGIDGWQDEYRFLNTDVICRLSVKFGDMWITKEDGAPQTNFEAFKGGISGALKRAAVKFGIGRYLYNLPETHVSIQNQKDNSGDWNYINDTKNNIRGYWKAPELPAWALPINGETQPGKGDMKEQAKAGFIQKCDSAKKWLFNHTKSDEEFFKILGMQGFSQINEVTPDKYQSIIDDLKASMNEIKAEVS